MPYVLFARPSYEEATFYLSAYLGLAVEDAAALGYDVVDLYAEEATVTNFLEQMSAVNPNVVIIGGHGSESTVHLQYDETLFRACENDEVMEGRVVEFVSCLTAQILAPSCRDKSAEVVLAWQEEFVFILDEAYEDRPLEDPYAHSFFRPVLEGVKALLSSFLAGRGMEDVAREAYEATVRAFNEEIAFWWGSTDPAASQILTWLVHDRDNLLAFTKLGIYRRLPRPRLGPSILALGLVVTPLFLKVK